MSTPEQPEAQGRSGKPGQPGAWRVERAGSVLRVRGVTIWPPLAALRALRGLPRDVALLQASNTLQKTYGVAYNVVAFRLLGDTGYGQFLLVLSLYNTLNLLGSMGLGQFLVVPLAQAAAGGDRKAVARALGYTVKLSCCISVGVLLLALATGPWFGELAYRGDFGRQLGSWMRIVALGAVPSVAYSLATTSLQALRRMRELALVENVDGLLNRVIGIAALLAGFGVPGMLWGVALGGTLSAAHALYQYRRVAVRQHGFPGFGALAGEALRVPFGAYMRFSALAVLDKNVAQFFGQTPMLFLGRWAGPEQAAYFGVASKLFTLLAAFHGAASRAFSVRLSQEYGEHGPAATRRLFWRSLLIWGAISTVGAAAFACLLPLFRWIYTPAALPSVTLVIVFAALTAKQGFTVSLGSIFLILDRVLVNVLVKAPLLLLAMPAGAWLVQRWSGQGVAGGAVAAATYQLGAYLLGDAIYFSIVATPWFWRLRGSQPQGGRGAPAVGGKAAAPGDQEARPSGPAGASGAAEPVAAISRLVVSESGRPGQRVAQLQLTFWRARIGAGKRLPDGRHAL
jgi:O-antigen/teichoic acid export membrane protein